MNTNQPDCGSPPLGKRGKPFIMTYRHHLMIKRIEFLKAELNGMLRCGNLDHTAAVPAEEYMSMIEQDIKAFVNEVHERSIWLQEKKGRNGSIKKLWITRLGNRQVTSKTLEGLYEKIYYYYKTGNPYLGNKNQHSLRYLFPRFMKD